MESNATTGLRIVKSIATFDTLPIDDRIPAMKSRAMLNIHHHHTLDLPVREVCARVVSQKA